MKILLLGAGGREHALAWKLHQSPRLKALYALPGNPGMAAQAELLAGDPAQPETVLAAAARLRPDLVVIGPETPLAAGVSDALRARGYAVFGPSRAAAQLESSKAFAKRFLERHHIPTARYAVAEDLAAAETALAQFSYPVVLKADGLAAGKGVVIAESAGIARETLAGFFSGALVGRAGARVVLEEFLAGAELSLLALCNGREARLLPPARDHKRLLEGDRGPNTGGMGAVSHDALLPSSLRARIEHEIIAPTLAGMQAEQSPFQGILYCGLMLTAEGPKVLEFNVRFGDPETQALMPRAEGDLAEAFLATAQGDSLGSLSLAWSPEPSACVVLAAAGYPGPLGASEPVTGLETAETIPGITVFCAGLARDAAGWRTAGGRVLALACRAPRLQDALARCYQAAEVVQFNGKQYRRDIGASLV